MVPQIYIYIYICVCVCVCALILSYLVIIVELRLLLPSALSLLCYINIESRIRSAIITVVGCTVSGRAMAWRNGIAAIQDNINLTAAISARDV